MTSAARLFCLLGLLLAACGTDPAQEPVQREPEPTCTDAKKNGDETDVDCGGRCGDCVDGKACERNGDCASGTCDTAVCVTPPACDDVLKNGDETDTDCGGSCSPCADGRRCVGDEDCAAGLRCQGTYCAPKQLTCGEALECSDACAGVNPTPCRTACLQNTNTTTQGKLVALSQCIGTACPTTGGGVCDSAVSGFDRAACNACIDAAFDFEAACWNPLLACIEDEG